MSTLTLEISEELDALLRAVSARRHLPPSDLVREVLENAVVDLHIKDLNYMCNAIALLYNYKKCGEENQRAIERMALWAAARTKQKEVTTKKHRHRKTG